MSVVFKFGAVLAVIYGIIGIILGIRGVAMPCNRYADAIVTGCVPGSTFGNFRFNITYVDYVGGRHGGEILSASTGVVGQTLRICYPLKNPGAFQTNGVVMFADPVVAWVLLGTAIPLLFIGAFFLTRFARTPSKSGDEIEKEFIIPMGIVKSSNP